MLVTEFSDTCFQYTNFEVWEIENLDAFFKGSAILPRIFFDFYKIPFAELKSRREEIADTDFQIIMKLLSQVDDKHFLLFTLHDENHLELVKMQSRKIMDFGINIEQIRNDRVYVMLMDKKMQSQFS